MRACIDDGQAEEVVAHQHVRNLSTLDESSSYKAAAAWPHRTHFHKQEIVAADGKNNA